MSNCVSTSWVIHSKHCVQVWTITTFSMLYFFVIIRLLCRSNTGYCIACISDWGRAIKFECAASQRCRITRWRMYVLRNICIYSNCIVLIITSSNPYSVQCIRVPERTVGWISHLFEYVLSFETSIDWSWIFISIPISADAGIERKELRNRYTTILIEETRRHESRNGKNVIITKRTTRRLTKKGRKSKSYVNRIKQLL